MKPRIMYVELRTGFDGDGPAWIGRVTFSKTGRTLFYRGRSLQRSGGEGSNYVDLASGEEFWVSSVKADRRDRHWAGYGDVAVDPDAREEYERLIDPDRPRR